MTNRLIIKEIKIIWLFCCLPRITTAAAGVVGSVFQLRGTPAQRNLPASLIAQANFAWGSGGTSLNVSVQTSLDGGGTWCDAVNFTFATAVLRQVASVASTKIAAADAVVTATDGTLVANTVNDGIFGPLWRVRYSSVGTYGGNTTITVNAFSNGLVPSP
jgi:hypothetical protein